MIAALRHTPAGAFGSCRYKLKNPEENCAEYERLIDVFKAHRIGYFFYNGGGDSADTCLKVAVVSKKLHVPLQVLHIPKTVDNDLPMTDNCPGFGSVAKYVAVATREASFDVASMARTSTKVFVLEVMGRHAGWIAAAAGLAADETHPIPLVIIFPEVVFDKQRVLAKIKALVDRDGYCTVVVSEGARYDDGAFLADQGTRDSFGHAQLGGVAPLLAAMIKDMHGYKCHWAVADYLQRAARHLASQTDVEQAYALGKAAVEMALDGATSIMPTLVRIADDPYRWEIGTADLSAVANVEKPLPAEFLAADGLGITAACRRYLTPLIGGEDYPPYHNGLPQYARLKNTLLEKKLSKTFSV